MNRRNLFESSELALALWKLLETELEEKNLLVLFSRTGEVHRSQKNTLISTKFSWNFQLMGHTVVNVKQFQPYQCFQQNTKGYFSQHKANNSQILIFCAVLMFSMPINSAIKRRSSTNIISLKILNYAKPGCGSSTLTPPCLHLVCDWVKGLVPLSKAICTRTILL